MDRSRRLRIAVLTSSRADFGIYLPLLKRLRSQPEVFDFSLIVFGTHLSPLHGFTKQEIAREGFEISFEISSILLADDPNSIATSYALTALKFADFYKTHSQKFDWVICLGDRYEMAAAVAAGIPFGVKFAHIHGGETTLGAIDNIYRHCITLAAQLHFVASQSFRQRIVQLVGENSPCYVTGSLSLDNLDQLQLLHIGEFKTRWSIDLNIPSLLVTVHPETVEYDSNVQYSKEIIAALQYLVNRYQIVITMPNADTNGNIFRSSFEQFKDNNSARVFLIENFGTQNYFSCMKHAKFMIGNSSSGILEAASFGKYVINVGNRQKGRLAGQNVINTPFEHKLIIAAANELMNRDFVGGNIYKIGDAASIIVKALKDHSQ